MSGIAAGIEALFVLAGIAVVGVLAAVLAVAGFIIYLLLDLTGVL